MSELAYESAAELAAALGCSVDLVWALTSAGRIPHVRLGPQKTIYSKQAISEWLADESHASTIIEELKVDGCHTGLAEGAA